jgi:hypothetical protein
VAAEEWTCPRCGLIGDHHKTPDPDRCDECCAHDAALEMLAALRGLLPPERKPRNALEKIQHWEPENVRVARAAIAKAEGKA